MNSAAYVDRKIETLKNKGIPLSEAAWKAALLCVGWPYVFGARGEYCTPANRRRFYRDDHQSIKTACKNFEGKGSCSGCKWFPDGKKVRFFDCRGFTYWILLQIFAWKLMGSGATAQWNDPNNWREQGEVKDGIPQDVIVFLFQRDVKKPKSMKHTGLYYNGETCECSSGVQHFTKINAKWTHWGVPACVTGDIPAPVPPPVRKPTLRRGSTGPYVVECQQDLISLGYDVGKTGADGKYGRNTEKAVKQFQKEHDDVDGYALKVDGVVGEKTWGALDNAVGKNGN